MTATTHVPGAGEVRGRFRRAIERAIPWFDPDEAARRDARTEAIRRRSIAARLSAEQLTPEAIGRVRHAYAIYAAVMKQRERR